MPDWWLDELAHAGPEHLDAGYVEGYEAKAGYDPRDDVAALVRHGLASDATVVDLGAGTGVFAGAVAPHCRRVVAVDVSPAMVVALRARAEQEPAIEVAHAGFLSYEHHGAPPAAVFTRNALHQLPDFWKGIALDRIHRLLAPGGILRVRDLVFDVEPDQAAEHIPAWMSGAVDDPRRGWTAAELAEHVRTEFSTYRWLFEALLDHTGFEILECEYVRRAYGAYTCRRRDDREHGDAV